MHKEKEDSGVHAQSTVIISINWVLLAMPTKGKKDIVFRFIIECNSSLRDFYRPLGNNNNNNNRSIFI
jgi:hypothetical protein